jgi:hypothetical protein
MGLRQRDPDDAARNKMELNASERRHGSFVDPAFYGSAFIVVVSAEKRREEKRSGDFGVLD